MIPRTKINKLILIINSNRLYTINAFLSYVYHQQYPNPPVKIIEPHISLPQEEHPATQPNLFLVARPREPAQLRGLANSRSLKVRGDKAGPERGLGRIGPGSAHLHLARGRTRARGTTRRRPAWAGAYVPEERAHGSCAAPGPCTAGGRAARRSALGRRQLYDEPAQTRHSAVNWPPSYRGPTRAPSFSGARSPAPRRRRASSCLAAFVRGAIGHPLGDDCFTSAPIAANVCRACRPRRSLAGCFFHRRSRGESSKVGDFGWLGGFGRCFRVLMEV